MCCFLYRNLNFIKRSDHIGKILQDAVKKTGLKIDVIAQKAGYKRSTYYLHIKQKDLNLEILKKYGRAIGYDFSDLIPGVSEFVVSEDDVTYAKAPLNLSEAIKQINEWKEKYLALMEKYLKCIEKPK